MFFVQLLAGTILVCLTVMIHAIVLDRLMHILGHARPIFYRYFLRKWKLPMLILTVLGVFSAHIVQIWLWAAFYISVTEFSSFEQALYFSTSTFTTVGYGDVVLDKSWRLLSSFQAANGFILFGWSTAFIFEVMSKLDETDVLRKR